MFKNLVMGLSLACLSTSALAEVAVTKSFVVTPATQKSQPSTTLVKLNFRDVAAKAGVCPYYVKSLQYLDAVKVLSVELFQDFCANDLYGTSQGDLYWVVPKSLAAKGTRVELLINGKRNGALNYDDQAQAFKIED